MSTFVRRSKPEKSSSYDDFKAVFISIAKSSDAKLTTKEELLKGLQCCGRNPISSKLDEYWRSQKDGIDIDHFCEIVSKEEAITEANLNNAFKTIDINNDGFISINELKKLFKDKGETMSSDEINDLFIYADTNKDGKLDYKEFSKLVIKTVNDAKELARKQMSLILKDEAANDNNGKKTPSRENSDEKLERPSSSLKRSPLSVRSRDSSHEIQERSSSKLKNDPHSSRSRENSNDAHERPSSNLRKSPLSARSNSLFDSESENEYLDLKNTKKKGDSSDKASPRKKGETDKSLSNVLVDSVFGNRRQEAKSPTNPKRLSEFEEKPKASDRPDEIEIRIEAPVKSEITMKEPSNLKKWSKQETKGAFYIDDADKILSNSFILELHEKSKIYFEIEPKLTDLHSNQEQRNSDSLLVIVNEKETKLVGFTENKLKYKWIGQCELKAGKYFIYPYTSGCYLKKRASTTEKSKKLFKASKDNKITLTDEFIHALETIFNIIDLNSNAKLSREEYNNYSSMTTNEELKESDWKELGKNISFKKSEMTLDGFIESFKLEIENSESDINEEIWKRLKLFGFDKNLNLEQCCPYNLNIYGEESPIELYLNQLYPVSHVEKFLHDFIEQNGAKIKLKNLKPVKFFEYHNNNFAAFLLSNDGDEKVSIELNCSKSDNCISNVDKKHTTEITIKPNKKKIGIAFSPLNLSKDWWIRCTPKLL